MSGLLQEAWKVYKYEGADQLFVRGMSNFMKAKSVVDHHTGKLYDEKDEYLWGLYWIDPKEVYLTHIPTSYRNGDFHGVCGGSWDKYKLPFADSIFYQSFHDRFVNNIPWKKTAYYKRSKKKIETEGYAWESNSIEELNDKCKSVDCLYEDIKSSGYKIPSERDVDYKVINGIRVPDELIIAIGRDGSLIRRWDGRHRLAITKILDEKIPAIISLCHESYAEKPSFKENNKFICGKIRNL